MTKKLNLFKSMTVTQFDNGYWYADEIKVFAKEIGIQATAKLRKDELEKLIRHFLQTGDIKQDRRKNLSRSGVKDIELGLTLKLPIVNYTSNKETKVFIKSEALKIIPNIKHKSGVSYRLNRWRDDQINSGKKITYGDLVNQYIKLNQVEGRFAKIPSGRYINFLSDYLSAEKNATKEQAIDAWKKLKKLDLLKDYASWKRHQQTRK